MSVGARAAEIAMQALGYGLLLVLLYLLAWPVRAAWIVFRDARGDRPWLLHGLLCGTFVLLLPAAADLVFTGGVFTSALLQWWVATLIWE